MKDQADNCFLEIDTMQREMWDFFRGASSKHNIDWSHSSRKRRKKRKYCGVVTVWGCGGK